MDESEGCAKAEAGLVDELVGRHNAGGCEKVERNYGSHLSCGGLSASGWDFLSVSRWDGNGLGGGGLALPDGHFDEMDVVKRTSGRRIGVGNAF